MALHGTGIKIGCAIVLSFALAGWVVGAPHLIMHACSSSMALAFSRMEGAPARSCSVRLLRFFLAGSPACPPPRPPHTQIAVGGTAHASNECRENTQAWVEGGQANTQGHLQPFAAVVRVGLKESRAYDCGACLLGQVIHVGMCSQTAEA